MPDDVLFVADPPGDMDPAADSTYAMITEALRRGMRPQVATLDGLRAAGPRLLVRAVPVAPPADGARLEPVGEPTERPAEGFRVVFMRKDPPVDDAYLVATWLLELLPAHVPVVNAPAGLRALSEKLSILQFSDITPPTHIARDEGDLRQILAELGGQMILKPVFGFGGRGIVLARNGDPNLSTLLELATEEGSRWTVAQGFVPQASEGDKRILLVDGEPVGAVLRVPRRGELRDNFHAGGRARATDLDDRDRRICRRVGPVLRAHGQVFAGIDVIGGLLTEINVTSPTGIAEINRLGGLTGDRTMQARLWDAVLARLGES